MTKNKKALTSQSIIGYRPGVCADLSKIVNAQQATAILENLTDMLPEVVFIDCFRKENVAPLTVTDFQQHKDDNIQQLLLSIDYSSITQLLHPDDKQLFNKIHKAIIERLNSEDDVLSIRYFACNVRIQLSRTINQQPSYIMYVYKLKPIVIDNNTVVGLCVISSDSRKKSGNLRVYFKQNYDYEEYNFVKYKWSSSRKMCLTDRERIVLLLFKQGLSAKQVADRLECRLNTINKTLSNIYKKFEVNSITEAILYATNHRLFLNTGEEQKPFFIHLPYKFRRRKMEDAKLKWIQIKLDKGMRIRAIAKEERVSESSIRYHIRHGKLRGNSVSDE
jgi:DNA-binding CsgD family transcriptional regulator